MSTLGLSFRERLYSRLLFYGIVVSGLWVMNRFVPDPTVVEEAKWEALGVARAYIAVPVEEVERLLVRESR